MSALDPTTPTAAIYLSEMLPVFVEAWGPDEAFWPEDIDYLMARGYLAYQRGDDARDAAISIANAVEETGGFSGEY